MEYLALGIFLLSFSGGSKGGGFQDVVVEMGDGQAGRTCHEIKDKNICPNGENGITYWLYTRDHQGGYQLDPSNENLFRDAPFVKDKVKILIHGYTMDKDKAINLILRPAYFNKFNYNIISVDWHRLCKPHCYEIATKNVPTVGKCVGEFVNQLRKLRSDIGEIHMLGHSLGAHVAAWASLTVTPSLDRVTQFDPAEPLFSNNDHDTFRWPLGKFTDVWHTNAGLKGRDRPSGIADIFLNDETNQPECHCNASCSHLQVCRYYAETVTSGKSIDAFPCEGFKKYKEGKCNVPQTNDLVRFGEEFTDTAKRSFVAFTNDRPPYIIDGSQYTKPETFHSFRGVEQNCPGNNFNEWLQNLLNV